jgi:hypothetical protein
MAKLISTALYSFSETAQLADPSTKLIPFTLKPRRKVLFELSMRR